MSIIKATIFAAVLTTGPPAVPEVPSRPPVREIGIATTYGYGGLHGSHTADGQPFRPRAESTCAHKSIPLGTTVLVETPRGRSAWCRVTDRGPYMVQTPGGHTKAVTPAYIPSDGERWIRVLDLSIRAAVGLGAPADRGYMGPVRLRWWPNDRRQSSTVAGLAP